MKIHRLGIQVVYNWYTSGIQRSYAACIEIPLEIVVGFHGITCIKDNMCMDISISPSDCRKSRLVTWRKFPHGIASTRPCVDASVKRRLVSVKSL